MPSNPDDPPAAPGDGDAEVAPRRGFLDEFDTIRVGFLKSYGLLREKAAELEWQWSMPADRVDARVRWDPSIGRLELTSGQAIHSIAVERTNDGHGEKTYLVCPLSGRRCAALFLVDGRLGSRQALGLRHRSSALSLLERKQWKFDNGGRLPEYVPQDPLPLAKFALVPKPSKRGTLRRQNAWDTESALRAGSIELDGIKQARAAFLAERGDALTAVALDVGGGPRLPPTRLKSAVFEWHPRLELTALRQAGFVIEGERTTVVLGWDSERTGLEWTVFNIDLRDPGNPYLVLESKVGDKLYPQVVLLTEPDLSPRRRRFFLCPSNGQRVETLAFRDGRWASMKAQNLKQANCTKRTIRSSPTSATVRRAAGRGSTLSR